MQDRRLPRWRSPLFHYSAFATITGHVIGILMPGSATHALGIPETRLPLVLGHHQRHRRRARHRRRRPRQPTAPDPAGVRHQQPVDYVALILLLVVILTGIAPTLAVFLGFRPRGGRVLE